MKFIIEKKDLTRLLRVLGSDPAKKAHDSVLRLAAQDGQIILNAYETEAGCEALVLEEGVCFFRIDQFLPLIRTYASAKNLTMEVTPEGIQIGNTKIGRGLWEISLFQDPRTAPIAAPNQEEARLNQLAAKEIAENPPLFTSGADPQKCHSATSQAAFPIAEDELQLVANVIRHTRRFCVLPTVTPPQLAGLARALFALERLPRISEGVDVTVLLGIPTGSPDDFTSQWATYQISDGAFSIGRRSISSSPASDNSTILYKVDNSGYRSMGADNLVAWTSIFDWNKHVCALLDQNPHEALMLSVYDKSKPDCMKPCDGE